MKAWGGDSETLARNIVMFTFEDQIIYWERILKDLKWFLFLIHFAQKNMNIYVHNKFKEIVWNEWCKNSE